jgi:hypothetical protein
MQEAEVNHEIVRRPMPKMKLSGAGARNCIQPEIPVGAAEGCDLLILETKSKDRSVPQLLHGDAGDPDFFQPCCRFMSGPFD